MERSLEKDYFSLGFTYGMGDVMLKAGMIENNNLSSMDTGVSFCFSALEPDLKVVEQYQEIMVHRF